MQQAVVGAGGRAGVGEPRLGQRGVARDPREGVELRVGGFQSLKYFFDGGEDAAGCR